jgi:hypothetical protein
MGNDKDKIARAADILKKYRVGEIAGKLLNDSFRYSSTPDVSFDRRIEKEYLEESANGVLINHQEHELVVATTKFRSSSAPDDDSSYADGLIYFDGVLVLKVGVNKEYDEYGSTIDFKIYDFSIKSMKAGDWLSLLTTCFEILEEDVKHRDELNKAKQDRQQASEIDLGDY